MTLSWTLLLVLGCGKALAQPPATNEEVSFNTAVANLESQLSSGVAAKQIASGEITADTISINLNSLLVERNYVNQLSAITSFRDGFGTSTAPAPSNAWFDVALSWTGVILGLIGEPAGILATGLTIFTNGINTLRTATASRVGTTGASALDLSTKWKTDLPNQRSALVLTVQEFTSAVKADGSNEKLLAAYKIHIQMIKGSQSPRQFFNEYYAGYYQSTTTPANTNFKAMHVTHEDRAAPGGGRETVLTSIYQATVLARHPKEIDGCHIAKTVLEVNDNYLTPLTPGLKGLATSDFKFLLTSNVVTGNLHSWTAYQYSCADLSSPEGFITANQGYIGRKGYVQPQDAVWVQKAMQLPWAKIACAQDITPATPITTLPWSASFFCDGCFHAIDFGQVLRFSKCAKQSAGVASIVV